MTAATVALVPSQSQTVLACQARNRLASRGPPAFLGAKSNSGTSARQYYNQASASSRAQAHVEATSPDVLPEIDDRLKREWLTAAFQVFRRGRIWVFANKEEERKKKMRAEALEKEWRDGA